MSPMKVPEPIALICASGLDRQLNLEEVETLSSWINESDANRRSFVEWYVLAAELRAFFVAIDTHSPLFES